MYLYQNKTGMNQSRRFSSIVAISHANIYDSIHCLRGDSSRTETVLAKLLRVGNFLKNEEIFKEFKERSNRISRRIDIYYQIT